MRLRDARRLLEENVDKLQANFQGISNQQVDFSNRATVRRSLEAIQNVPSLSERVAGILNDRVFTNDSSLTPSGNHGPIQQAIQSLQTDAKALLAFLKVQVPKDPDGSFSVRFPESDSSASIIAKRFESLHRAFEQPVARVFGEALAITLVEPGSVMVELGLYLHAAGTVAGATISVNQILSLVGRLLTLGMEKAKLDQERAKADQEREKARQEAAKAAQEEAKGEQLHLALRAAETAVKIAELKSEAAALEVEGATAELATYAKDPHDAIPILRNAITEIAELYSANTEFLLQLGAAQDVQKHFPNEMLPENLILRTPAKSRR